MTTQESYGPTSYGSELADIYDHWITRLQQDTDATVRFLAEHTDRAAKDTGARTALELGVGTGRVALPLAGLGVEVTGVDASEEMLGLLRAKPGADAVTLVTGDFTDPPARGPYTLAYIVFNTLYSLPTQDDQVRCLANTARLLADGGLFVFQGFVPDTARFEAGHHSGHRMEVARTAGASLSLGIARHDPVAQHMYPRYSLTDAPADTPGSAGATGGRDGTGTGAGTREHTVRFRYVWPAELDLMARLAGLTLERRFADWEGTPFAADSQAHVSVYRKSGPAPR
ncbi:class I SAM-dependent DNA methyltransferase [Kitasatospora sp. NPDC056327]|uniref:class I SAM-dependent DNA methyltransferase n=1 Tax=Kitasatospora sp. NPDC056327 TaxID=3345785 RepID=UPI0035E22F02